MRILVTGSGLLGSCMGLSYGKAHETTATYNRHPISIDGCGTEKLDICDAGAVEKIVSLTKPDIVFHTAANVDVDYCESHHEEAHAINAEGAANVAKACEKSGAMLVYISSDFVFDGKAGNYSEKDKINPINYYGQTKLEGEKAAMRECPDALIVRTSIYGLNPHGRNSFATWVTSSLSSGREIKVFNDMYFTPILTNSLAGILLSMAKSGASGIYNVAGVSSISKYDLALKVADAHGLDKNLIKPNSWRDAEFKAPRPVDVSLDCSKARSKFPGFLDYDESLKLMRSLSDGGYLKSFTIK
ncbi:MAG: SDR family oxidoreductase [Candidatus Altiarchaeota archaeon]|nr:SDR family oxidoreductase [Candidatus Altiarchaeota archaeon]